MRLGTLDCLSYNNISGIWKVSFNIYFKAPLGLAILLLFACSFVQWIVWTILVVSVSSVLWSLRRCFSVDTGMNIPNVLCVDGLCSCPLDPPAVAPPPYEWAGWGQLEKYCHPSSLSVQRQVFALGHAEEGALYTVPEVWLKQQGAGGDGKCWRYATSGKILYPLTGVQLNDKEQTMAQVRWRFLFLHDI